MTLTLNLPGNRPIDQAIDCSKTPLLTFLISKQENYTFTQSIILWKHHENLPSQSFRIIISANNNVVNNPIIIATDEDPSSSLGIESIATINLRGVSTKLYFD